jgi:hypothetical protein
MSDLRAKFLLKHLRKKRKRIQVLDRRKQRRRGLSSFKSSARDAGVRLVCWANKAAIKEVYKIRPLGYEIDHIIPLRGKLVSGLHVAENLQYLLPQVNREKKNNFIPYREKDGEVVEYYTINYDI